MAVLADISSVGSHNIFGSGMGAGRQGEDVTGGFRVQ